MNTFENWEQQKPALHAALGEQSDMSGVVYAVRHALLQTEQNTLAQMQDDVLRQQIGIIFSSLKTSVGLLEANIMTKVWVPQAQKSTSKPKSKASLWVIAALIQIIVGLICYFKNITLGWTLALAALVISSIALFSASKTKATPILSMDEVRITLKPDADKLFGLLDAQLRAIDRYISDFAYLNEQLRGGAECTDNSTLTRVADLLEALYDCEAEVRAPAEDAAKQMLESMGLRALDYSNESHRLFTALPSKSETRTLSPAIVSIQDYRLLKRGTAAVKMDVA